MKRIPKKLIPFLVAFAVYVLVTLVTRAISILTVAKKEGDITVIGPKDFLSALWLEVRSIIMPSRYM